jgi:hypothetical protein
MRTETISVYKFGELSAEAKQKAIDKHSYEDFWWSERDKSLEAAKELYDKFNELQETIKGVRLYKFIQNNILPELKKNLLYVKADGYTKGYTTYVASKIRGKNSARFSKIQYTEEASNLTGYSADYAFLEPISDFMKNPEDSITSEDLYNTSLDDIAQEDANNDWKSFYDEENFEEHCDANNYEFTENGDRF